MRICHCLCTLLRILNDDVILTWHSFPIITTPTLQENALVVNISPCVPPGLWQILWDDATITWHSLSTPLRLRLHTRRKPRSEHLPLCSHGLPRIVWDDVTDLAWRSLSTAPEISTLGESPTGEYISLCPSPKFRRFKNITLHRATKDRRAPSYVCGPPKERVSFQRGVALYSYS